MKSSIGIGVIGTGFARRTQIPGFAAIGGAEIISVASRKKENAAAVAKEFSVGHFTGDWRETITNTDVDLVCITTPPNLHLEMTIEALKNGKHVLCEKPMAMNTAEAEEMTRIARQARLMAVIDHELRFTNGRLRAYDMIRAGKIGKVRHAKYLFRNASRGNPQLPWTWWSDIDQGGGALGAIGSHVIDSFRWFLDCEIKNVFCRLHTHIKTRPAEGGSLPVTTDDETLLLLELGDSPLVEDATALVTASMVEAGPYRNRIELFGSKGALRVEDGGEVCFADINKRNWQEVELELGEVAPGMQVGGWSRGFTVIAQKIVDALLNNNTTFEHAPTFFDGLQIQRVLDAARESDSTGGIIEVKSDPDSF